MLEIHFMLVDCCCSLHIWYQYSDDFRHAFTSLTLVPLEITRNVCQKSLKRTTFYCPMSLTLCLRYNINMQFKAAIVFLSCDLTVYGSWTFFFATLVGILKAEFAIRLLSRSIVAMSLAVPSCKARWHKSAHIEWLMLLWTLLLLSLRCHWKKVEAQKGWKTARVCPICVKRKTLYQQTKYQLVSLL